MAQTGERPAATYIKNYISTRLNATRLNTTPLYEAIRYDNIWFEKFPPNLHEWSRGAPDFVLPVEYDAKPIYFKTEIKLKDQEYRKTQWGGITPNGSIVPNYGCASYYLDVVPVYKNMKDFCQKSGVPTSKFIIAFGNPTTNAYHLITLASIDYLLINGWNSTPIAIFAEGYGQPAYLIPKNATMALDKLTPNDFLAMSMHQVIMPPCSPVATE